MITIYDVAKKANVSTMTVSRVINNSPLIKKETRLKVEKAIQELEFIPNRTARGLVSKDSQLLSLIITDIANPFFTNIARGAEDKANQLGYQVVFSNSDENVDKETAYIRSAIARRIDGVLLAPACDDSIHNVHTLTKHKIPYVLLDREIEGVEADLVMGDNSDATHKLVHHLVANGHKKIAFLSGPSNISNTRQRQAAYIEALQLVSLPADVRWIHQTALKNINTDEIIRLLLSLPKEEQPTAILATNNFIAVEAVKTLRSLKLSVPADMTIVCFDDPESIPDFNPFLTVISQPAYEFGSIGMQLLIDRIEGKVTYPFRKVTLPSKLLVRCT